MTPSNMPRRLRQRDFPRRRAQAHALSDVLHANLTELATKTDLNALEARLTAQIREIELRMTIKLGSMLVIAVGVIAALVKLL